MYDFYVLLGCFGLTQDGFTCCAGVENVILKVNTSLPDYNEMMNYFDQCRLFDRPMFDLNAVRHFVFNLQDRYSMVTRPLWSVKKFELYQKFIIDHRHCGVYIKLQLPESSAMLPEPTPPKKEEIVLVKKSSENLSNKLRLIRSKQTTVSSSNGTTR